MKWGAPRGLCTRITGRSLSRAGSWLPGYSGRMHGGILREQGGMVVLGERGCRGTSASQQLGNGAVELWARQEVARVRTETSLAGGEGWLALRTSNDGGRGKRSKCGVVAPFQWGHRWLRAMAGKHTSSCEAHAKTCQGRRRCNGRQRCPTAIVASTVPAPLYWIFKTSVNFTK